MNTPDQEQHIPLSALSSSPVLQRELRHRFSVEMTVGSRFEENLRLSVQPGDSAIGDERLCFTLQGTTGGSVSVTLHASEFSNDARNELNTLLAHSGAEVGSGLCLDDDLLQAFSGLRDRISRRVITPLKKETLYAFGVMMFESLREYTGESPQFTKQKTVDLRDFTPDQQRTILTAMKDCLTDRACEFQKERAVPFCILMAMHQAGVEFTTEELVANLQGNRERYRGFVENHHLNLAYLAWIESQVEKEPKDFDHIFGQIFGRGHSGDCFYREPVVIQTDQELRNSAAVTCSLEIGQSFLATEIAKAKEELKNPGAYRKTAYENPAHRIIRDAARDATVLDLREPQEHARIEDFESLARISQAEEVDKLEEQYTFLEAEAAPVLDRNQLIFHRSMDPEKLEKQAIKMAKCLRSFGKEDEFQVGLKGIMHLVSKAGLIRYQRGEAESLKKHLKEVRYQVLDQLLPREKYSTIRDLYRRYGLTNRDITKRVLAYADTLLTGEKKNSAVAIRIYCGVYGKSLPIAKLKLIEKHDPYAVSNRKIVFLQGYGDSLPAATRKKIADDYFQKGELDQAREHYAVLGEEITAVRFFQTAKEKLLHSDMTSQTGRKYLERAYEMGHRKLTAEELYETYTEYGINLSPNPAQFIQQQSRMLIRNLRDWHDLIDPDSFKETFKPEEPKDYTEKTYREHLKKAALHLASKPPTRGSPHQYTPLFNYFDIFEEDKALVADFRKIIGLLNDDDERIRFLKVLAENKTGEKDPHSQAKRSIYPAAVIQSYVYYFDNPLKLPIPKDILTPLIAVASTGIEGESAKKDAEQAIKLTTAAKFASGLLYAIRNLNKVAETTLYDKTLKIKQIVKYIFTLTEGVIAELDENSVNRDLVGIDPEADRKILIEFCLEIVNKKPPELKEHFDQAVSLMKKLGLEYTEADRKQHLRAKAEAAAREKQLYLQAKYLRELEELSPVKKRKLALSALKMGEAGTAASILKMKNEAVKVKKTTPPVALSQPTVSFTPSNITPSNPTLTTFTFPADLFSQAVTELTEKEKWDMLVRLDNELQKNNLYVDEGKGPKPLTLTKKALQPAIDHYLKQEQYEELASLNENRPDLEISTIVAETIKTLPEDISTSIEDLVRLVPSLRTRADFISRVLADRVGAFLSEEHINYTLATTSELFAFARGRGVVRQKNELPAGYTKLHEARFTSGILDGVKKSSDIAIVEQILDDEAFLCEKIESGEPAELRDLVVMALSCRVQPQQDSPLAGLIENHREVATLFMEATIEAQRRRNDRLTDLRINENLRKDLLYIAEYFGDIKLAAFLVSQSKSGVGSNGIGAGPTVT